MKETWDSISDLPTDGTIALGKFDEAQLLEMKGSQNALLLVDSDGTSQGIDSLVVDFKSSVQKSLNILSPIKRNISLCLLEQNIRRKPSAAKRSQNYGISTSFGRKGYDEGPIIEADFLSSQDIKQ